MTLAETYALSCGVKLPITPADFPTNFYPLPDKYITLTPKSNQGAKDYNYFDIVVSILAPYLIKKKIAILQLGLPDERHISGTFKPNLTLRQTAHAVKNALAHVSVDSMTAHLAGNFKTPLVEVFGSTSSDSARPHYLGKHIFLNGYSCLPSYSSEEFPKAINSINPEDLASAILEILNIKDKITLKTQFIGSRYNHPGIELIPNFRPDYSKLSHPMNVRMDLCHNEEILSELIRFHPHPFVLTLNRPLSHEFPKHKFVHTNYFFGEEYKKSDLLSLGQWGAPISFVYTGPREKISFVRTDLESPFEFGVIIPLKEPAIVEDLSETSRFNTQKVILSGGKSFSSIYHAKSGIPGIGGILVGKAKDSRDFLDSLDNFYIYTS